MRKRSNPTLFDWAIIRVRLSGKPEVSAFLFTGIGFGHPRLDDFVLFATTEVQEIGEDGTWGRTRSRIYNLEQPLKKHEFTAELTEEVKEIFQQERGTAVEVEWISIEEWRKMADSGGNPSPNGPANSVCRL